NSTFSGNSVDDFGSGIYNNGPLAVTNSTFSGNFGSRGGGIYNSAGTLAVTNSTFSGNYPSYGGGIFNDSGTANLAGNVFAAGSGGDNCTNSGTINDNGYNLSDDASCGFSGTSADNATLNLGTLADNGGPTQTHALLSGSDAINAIPYDTNISNNGTAWTCNDADPFTDQRGVSRPQGSGCDSGAYEATVPDVSITPSSDSIAEGTNT
ncbi:MAG: hypothetical protein KC423_28765, partial [Anaerolineales bacterium]|nr:hypothetical protein [Anaerolineales bacterium]